MPRGDRTGPRGAGPMTGRAAGYCAGYGTAGYLDPGFGRNCGSGRAFGGGGRGWRNMYYATGLPGWARDHRQATSPVPRPYGEPDAAFEKQALKDEADTLRARLDLVEKRLSDLEASAE